MLKNSKPRGRPKYVETDYLLLDELVSLDDIPDLGIKILKHLGKGKIKVGSAEKMLSLLGYLDKLAISTIDRVSKQKYKLICQAADQLQSNKILEIAKIQHEKALDLDDDFEESD